ALHLESRTLTQALEIRVFRRLLAATAVTAECLRWVDRVTVDEQTISDDSRSVRRQDGGSRGYRRRGRRRGRRWRCRRRLGLVVWIGGLRGFGFFVFFLLGRLGGAGGFGRVFGVARDGRVRYVLRGRADPGWRVGRPACCHRARSEERYPAANAIATRSAP